MGTVIRVIFREGVQKQHKDGRVSRTSLARQRGLTLWCAREDLVFAAAYRLALRAENSEIHEIHASTCQFPAKRAPQG
jgi:hypothetical protein